ncbi:MAG: 8-amino-7-oxononanoate synthase [Stagnimonas sp.]|nr:8-amino-7-oxononanoate synthase [Stagnimonas sp.]
MSPLDQRLATQLAQARAQDLHRVRRIVEGGHGARIVVDGRDCLNFCSNDYLGLATDPRLAEAARAALGQGTGSGAAALVSGYNREHAALEEELADFLQRPRALLFSSGWAANLGVLRALLGREDVLIADELNHASLIDGGRLAGARYVRVPHADVAAYAAALQDEAPLPLAGRGWGRGAVAAGGLAPKSPETRERVTGECPSGADLPPPRDWLLGTDSMSVPSSANRPPRKGEGDFRLIATDSVFSMDGDLAPLAELSRLSIEHGATLMVDDAHGFGVLGPDGRGALAATGAEADILMAGFGKALGTAGACIVGSEPLIDYLVQRARTWVFSTAPPPALAAATRASLRLIRSEEGRQRRARLQAHIARFRAGAAQLGLPLSASETAIQPLVLGEAARAMAVSRALYQRGHWVAAIRPPTVPAGTSRLRITLSAAHSEAEIDGLLTALAEALRAA